LSQLRTRAFGKKSAAGTRFGYGVGGRKRAKAFVNLVVPVPFSSSRILVNGKPCEDYFPWGIEAVRKIGRPLERLSLGGVFEVRASVRGGGTTGQLDAVALGVSRGIVSYYERFLTELTILFYVSYLVSVQVPLRWEAKKSGDRSREVGLSSPDEERLRKSYPNKFSSPAKRGGKLAFFLVVLRLRIRPLRWLGLGVMSLNKTVGKLRSFLRSEGYLTPDLRRKERKKYGLRKARKAPQYSKR
jgi:small subunit ribosomal protein S9